MEEKTYAVLATWWVGASSFAKWHWKYVFNPEFSALKVFFQVPEKKIVLKCKSILGQTWWYCKLGLCLQQQQQHPMWISVQVLDAPVLIQFSTYGLRKQPRVGRVLGPLHPCGKPRRNSQLLIFWCAHLRLFWPFREWASGFLSLPHTLSLFPLTVPSNKNKLNL